MWSRSQSAACGAISAFGEVAHDVTELLLFGRRGRTPRCDRTRSRYRRVPCDVAARIRPASILRHLPRDAAARSSATARRRSSATRPRDRAPAAASAFAALDEIDAGGFWVGFFAYDLGRAIEHIEPRTRRRPRPPRPRVRRVRHAAGAPRRRRRRADRRPRGRARLEAAVRAAADDRAPGAVALDAGRRASTASTTPPRARSVHELLAGRRVLPGEPHPPATLDAARRSDRAVRRARARRTPRRTRRCCVFGAALPGVAVVSASPELFLAASTTARAGRDAPDQGHRVRSPRRSRASAKDRAENVMIVDLARNDLGRVCEFGSVRGARAVRGRGAPRPRPPREHGPRPRCAPTSASPTSCARRSRPRRSPARRSRACMQAIEDLEPVRRGVYCGAIGWIDGDRGRAELVGRDPHVHDRRRRARISASAAASSPTPIRDAEWAETELKAARLLLAAGTARRAGAHRARRATVR